jgi:hypothetical protein
MSAGWRYRGREVRSEDVAFIQRLIAEHPGASRRELSQKLCEAWRWRQANGARAHGVSRLAVDAPPSRSDQLPPVRYTPPNPLVRRAQ